MCSCGLRGGTGPVWGCGDKCCGNAGGVRLHDMITDPCAQKNWNHCKAQIYGKAEVSCPFGNPFLSNISPCCRFPPKRCPPPPPPPRNVCTCHRCNPNRACGFIVKPSNYPCGRPECCPCDCGCPCVECCESGCGGNLSCSVPCPCVGPDCCGGCPLPDPFCPCKASCSVHCRPAWRTTALKASPYCLDPPPLPPRSFRYKCWLSQFKRKVDSNLCPSRYSSRVDNCCCNMVIAEPPDCDPCSPCPCHPMS